MNKPSLAAVGITASIIAALTMLALLMGSCAGVNQANLRIEDPAAVRLTKEGGRLYNKKLYAQALGKFSEAEAAASSAADKARIAEILAKAAYALYERKLYDDSLSYYAQAGEIYERLGGNTPALVETLSYTGKIHSDIGKYRESIGYFLKALALQEDMDGGDGVSRVLNNLANLHSYLGEYGESIRLLERALKIAEDAGDSAETASALTNLAVIHYRQRNYRIAVEYLSGALDAARKSGDKTLEATALSVMGIVSRFQGDYDSALGSYNEALEINKKAADASKTATTLSIIGELYSELGRHEEAIGYFEGALSIAKSEKDALMTAVNLNYIGEAKFGQGKFEEALGFYAESAAEFEALGFRDRIARSFNNIAYAKGAMGEFDEAFINFDKALAIYRDIGDRQWIRVALFGKGLYYEKRGDAALAEANYKEAVEVFESIRRDVSGGDAAEQLISDVNMRLYEKLVSLLIMQGKLEEALDYVRRSRSKALRDNLLQGKPDTIRGGSMRRYDSLSKTEAAITSELSKERGNRAGNRHRIDNLSIALTDTQREIAEVTSKLQKENPRLFSAMLSTKTPSRGGKSRASPTDFALIQYFVAEEQTFIFTVGEGGEVKVRTAAVSKQYLNRAVYEFRQLIYESSTLGAERLNLSARDAAERKTLLDALSTGLYDSLIKPVAADIQNTATVGIVPFGILNYLPFQALAESKPGGGRKFFIEQKKIIYITTGSGEVSQRATLQNAVAFGNPDVGSTHLALPYSEKEVAAVKSAFPGAIIYLKSQATKEHFTKSWGKFSLVHLSAHGVLNDEGQFILLAPNLESRLSATDITALPPSDEVALVVLSACSTAIDPFQENPSGAALATLAYAFELVDVPSVVATLWDISDRGTADLMGEFYENLKQGGDFDSAFREAQINMIRRGGLLSHPYYWAAFVIFENPR
ncbi:MAG: tetratricopeptide repeat protein [Deltaproteobacteria bacterium]